MAGILKVDKYQDFNGNDIMTSDGSGNLTLNNAAMKNTPAFGAYKTADQSAFPNTTYTKITFDAEYYDTDSAFDLTNNRFTVPSGKAGKYIFGAMIRNNTSTDFEQFQITLYKNGSNFSSPFTPAGTFKNGNNNSSILNATLELAAADYIEVYGYQNSGGNITIRDDGTHFWGFRLIGV